METISVVDLLEETSERFGLRLAAGKGGLSKKITTSRIQKPGLLLTGLLEKLHSERIQIFGKAEINYLKSLPENRLKPTLKLLEKADTPCYVITRKQKPPSFLSHLAAPDKPPPCAGRPPTLCRRLRDGREMEERLAPT